MVCTKKSLELVELRFSLKKFDFSNSFSFGVRAEETFLFEFSKFQFLFRKWPQLEL